MSLLQAENYWKVKRSIFQRLIRERFPFLSLHISFSSNSQWKFLNQFHPCNTNIYKCLSFIRQLNQGLSYKTFLMLFIRQLYFLRACRFRRQPFCVAQIFTIFHQGYQTELMHREEQLGHQFYQSGWCPLKCFCFHLVSFHKSVRLLRYFHSPLYFHLCHSSHTGKLLLFLLQDRTP